MNFVDVNFEYVPERILDATRTSQALDDFGDILAGVSNEFDGRTGLPCPVGLGS